MRARAWKSLCTMTGSKERRGGKREIPTLPYTCNLSREQRLSRAFAYFFAHLRDSFYLVHERRLPRPSRSMYFGDVSETKGWDTHSEIKKLARKTWPETHRPCRIMRLLRRQRGRVVSASDWQAGGPGFESRSGQLLDLCSFVPSLNSRPRLLITNWLPFASWGF